MAYTPIDDIPTGLRSQPQQVFDEAMAGFMVQLPNTIDQINAAGAQTDAAATAAAGSQAAAAGSAGAALTSQNAAAASASTAVNAPGSGATSTTSDTIALGATNITIQTGKLFGVGQFVVIASTASPTNWMSGPITAYNSGTGSFTVNATNMSGSGTFAAWTIGLVGAPGFTGIVNEQKGANVASASTIDLDAATGNYVHITGTTGISTMTLAAGAERVLMFENSLILTHNASLLVLPGGVNITTSGGDVVTVRGAGSGATRVIGYTRANGLPIVDVGANGMSITGSVTLVSTSPGNIVCTTATDIGCYATLSNATTFFKHANLFTITNNGLYDYGVKDSSGTVLGWIRPGQVCSIGLNDNGSAAGVWALNNAYKIGCTAIQRHPMLAGTTTKLQVMAVGSLKIIMFSHYNSGTASANLYCVVYDTSTRTWGNPSLVRTSTAAIQHSSLYYDGIILLCASAVGNNLEVVTISISGTTATVNSGTKVAVTPANGITGGAGILSDMIAVNSTTAILGYNSNVGGQVNTVRGITVSGTTPTLGAEYTCGTAPMSHVPKLFNNGSVLRVLGTNSSGAMHCAPFTVSGTTLTLGTTASFTAGQVIKKASFTANNNIAVFSYSPSGNVFATIIGLSGTTETASNVTLHSAGSGLFYMDVVTVASNKMAVLTYTGDSGTLRVMIVWDTNGTGSASASANMYGGSPIMGAGAYGASLARFMLGSGHELIADCNGSTPFFIVINKLPYKGQGVSGSEIEGPPTRMLVSGTSTYYLGSDHHDLNIIGASPRVVDTLPEGVDQVFYGTSTSEAWATSTVFGTTLKRIEVAA